MNKCIGIAYVLEFLRFLKPLFKIRIFLFQSKMVEFVIPTPPPQNYFNLTKLAEKFYLIIIVEVYAH